MRNKNSKCNIPPWEDSPNNTFDKQSGWSSDSAHPIKKRRVEKARDRAHSFLGAHGCYTSRIESDHELLYLLSLCFGLLIDCNAKPKRELVRACRAIRNMGQKARSRNIRTALTSGDPAIREYWDPARIKRYGCN